MASKLAAYEQIICANENMCALVDQHKETIQVLSAEKSKLEALMDAAVKRVDAVEKRNFQLNKKLNNAVLAIRAKGEQTEILKNYLQEFKTKTHIYVPTDVSLKVKLDYRKTQWTSSWQSTSTVSPTRTG